MSWPAIAKRSSGAPPMNCELKISRVAYGAFSRKVLALNELDRAFGWP